MLVQASLHLHVFQCNIGDFTSRWDYSRAIHRLFRIENFIFYITYDTNVPRAAKVS